MLSALPALHMFNVTWQIAGPAPINAGFGQNCRIGPEYCGHVALTSLMLVVTLHYVTQYFLYQECIVEIRLMYKPTNSHSTVIFLNLFCTDEALSTFERQVYRPL